MFSALLARRFFPRASPLPRGDDACWEGAISEETCCGALRIDWETLPPDAPPEFWEGLACEVRDDKRLPSVSAWQSAPKFIANHVS